MGILNCLFAMSIYSISFERYSIETNKTSSVVKNSDSNSSKQDQGSSSLNKEKVQREYEDFWANLRIILAFGIPKRVSKMGTMKFPSAAMMFHGFVITTVGDTCTFLLREWMPFHIKAENLKWASSLVGALWLLTALEFAYWNIAVIADFFAAPVTPEMHHKNPLLSTSLAEFWGLRWNPVISKQLQDSIYKPLRKFGVHKSISVVACFTGSALLHAIPKLISEGSLEEFLMMFSFFFSQGFCLILEAIMQKCVYQLINAKQKSSKETKGTSKLSEQSEEKNHVIAQSQEEILQLYGTYMQTTRNNFFIELAIMMFFISGFYLLFEDRGQSFSLMTFVVVLLIYVFHRVISIQIDVFDKSNKGNRSIKVSKAVMILLIIFGWLWTVSCFITQLPLFVIPMNTAVSEFYSQSLVIGSFVRTLEKVNFLYVSS